MIDIKNNQEVKIMQEGGFVLKETMAKTKDLVRPGISTQDIENFARAYIEEKGMETSFDKVPGYKWATCICINEQIVHTPPRPDKIVKEGDLITIDMGVYHQGYHTDKAISFVVGKSNPKKDKFLEIGDQALKSAISVARAGNRVGHISSVIQSKVEGSGYYIARNLTGHGVGKHLHEEPNIPGFAAMPISETPILKVGMTLAIEVIYSISKTSLVTEPGSKWSIISKSGQLSACFEDTIAVTAKTPLILT